MKKIIIILTVLVAQSCATTSNLKYQKEANTFIIENFNPDNFNKIQRTLIINGYSINNFNPELQTITTAPKPIEGSVYAYDLKNSIVCYIENNRLIVYSNYSFEYNNLNGSMTNASGRCRYSPRNNVGSRIAFDETENIVQKINPNYKVVKRVN